MMKHTPGPWEVEKDNEIFGRYRIVGVDSFETQRISDGYDLDESEEPEGEEGDLRDTEARERDEANRLLIQAAPDLLAAAVSLLENWEKNLSDSGYVLALAVNKAMPKLPRRT
jgi:hypothetical protein